MELLASEEEVQYSMFGFIHQPKRQEKKKVKQCPCICRQLNVIFKLFKKIFMNSVKMRLGIK